MLKLPKYFALVSTQTEVLLLNLRKTSIRTPLFSVFYAMKHCRQYMSMAAITADTSENKKVYYHSYLHVFMYEVAILDFEVWVNLRN